MAAWHWRPPKPIEYSATMAYARRAGDPSLRIGPDNEGTRIWRRIRGNAEPGSLPRTFPIIELGGPIANQAAERHVLASPLGRNLKSFLPPPKS